MFHVSTSSLRNRASHWSTYCWEIEWCVVLHFHSHWWHFSSSLFSFESIDNKADVRGYHEQRAPKTKCLIFLREKLSLLFPFSHSDIHVAQRPQQRSQCPRWIVHAVDHHHHPYLLLIQISSTPQQQTQRRWWYFWPVVTVVVHLHLHSRSHQHFVTVSTTMWRSRRCTTTTSISLTMAYLFDVHNHWHNDTIIKKMNNNDDLVFLHHGLFIRSSSSLPQRRFGLSSPWLIYSIFIIVGTTTQSSERWTTTMIWFFFTMA